MTTDPQSTGCPDGDVYGPYASAGGDGTQSGRDLCRLGRHRLYTTPFEDYEKEIRKQLTGMFGQYGFDPDRDIGAITINRWSHGYAYEYMELFDPEWKEGEAPHELGRKPIGQNQHCQFRLRGPCLRTRGYRCGGASGGRGSGVSLLRHQLLNGWPLFYLVAGLTFARICVGLVVIGVSTPEAR